MTRGTLQIIVKAAPFGCPVDLVEVLKTPENDGGLTK